MPAHEPAQTNAEAETTVPLPDAPARVSLGISYPRANAVLVTVTGEIDAATIERVEDVLWPRLEAAVRVIVVDLSGLKFLGVPGLELLAQARLHASSRNIALRIVAPHHEVRHALQVAELELACYDHVLDALSETQ